MLTRVTFICDDSKVGKACRSLTGIAIEQPQVQPMANATAVKAQPRSRVRTIHEGQTLPELLKAQILKEGLERISASTMKVMTTTLGYAPLSVYKTLQTLVQDKFLRRVEQGIYEVRKNA